MALTSVFNFTKTRKAVAELEQLLWCNDCNGMYKNPRRDVYSGVVKCSCQEGGERGDLTPDCFLSNIIEAVGMIKEVITEDSEESTKEISKTEEICPPEPGEKKKESNKESARKEEKEEDEATFKVPVERANVRGQSRGRKKAMSAKREETSSGESESRSEEKQKASSRSSQGSGSVQPSKQLKEFSHLSEKPTKEISKAEEVCAPQPSERKNAAKKKGAKKGEEETFQAPVGRANAKRQSRGKKRSMSAEGEEKDSDESESRPEKKQKEKASSTSSQGSGIMQPSRHLKELMKRNTKGETKLHTACVKGNKAKVEELLAAGASPCTKDNAGWTPLHEAVSKGHNEIVAILLEAGAMVNVPGGFNNTPLHDAALNNNLEAARLLIKHGANPEARNIQGFTPRTMAETEEMKAILNDYFPENVISKREHHYISQNDVVLYGFGLNPKLQAQLTMLVRQFKMKQVAGFSQEITHMIVGGGDGQIEASVEVLRAILRGKWILRQDWVDCTLTTKQIADCCEYEITGTLKYPDSYAPRKGRENAEKLQPSLFSGCYFYLYGGNKFSVDDRVISKTELSALITAGDGVHLRREPDPEAIPEQECTVPYHASKSGALSSCSHYIIYQPGPAEPIMKYNMSHVKSLPVTWLLKCIETFSFVENF